MELTSDSLAHWKMKHTYWLGPDSDWSRQMKPKWSDCLIPYNRRGWNQLIFKPSVQE